MSQMKIVGVSAERAVGWKRWWWRFKARVEVWLRGGRKRWAILSFYRGSPWCNNDGIPATCDRIGGDFGAMVATVRGDEVIDDMRQMEHIYVGGQTTVKTWSWCKKWDEKNIDGWELSVFSLMRSLSWIYDDWISLPSTTKNPVMVVS
jgi:hypothetical protein